MKCTISFIVTVIVIVFGVLCDETRGMPVSPCNPTRMNELPPRIRKVCVALADIYELGAAMESYIDEKVSIPRDNAFETPLVKRQDVDHVFLRFGRRR